MFQRFKNALDSLEEQARKPAPSVPPRLPPTRRNAPSSQQSSRSTTKNQSVSGNATDTIEGPSSDPDPSSFDADFAIGEETPEPSSNPTRASTPNIPSTAEKQTLESKEDGTTTTTSALAGKREEEDEEAAQASKAPMELPTDVQSKLRKLNRLETKYQELLAAYRKAHARNSAIEPFEAKLREATPLTSIGDPAALVEYLTQLSQRGDLVMDELRKVVSERDSIAEKLKSAEHEAKKAHDEVTELKTLQSSLASSARDVSSTADDKGDGDFFSVDDEVPRLQSEISSRDAKIGALEKENASLTRELGSARESAEQMMRDSEAAQTKLESLKHDHARAQREGSEWKAKYVTLESELAAAQDSLLEREKALENIESTQSTLLAQIESQTTQIEHMEGQARAQATLVESLQQSRDQNASSSGATANESQTAETQASTAADSPASVPGHSANSSKKKKKKKGANSNANANANNESASRDREPAAEAADHTRGVEEGVVSLRQKLEACLTELKEKDVAIDRLHSELKSQEDMSEEIEHLRDELLNLGQEHVKAKDDLKILQEGQRSPQNAPTQPTNDDLKDAGGHPGTEDLLRQIRDLQEAKEQLTKKVQDLETKLEQKAGEHDSAKKERASRESVLTAETAQLKVKTSALETDLSASQALATTRFKEIQSLKERVQKMQPELGSLRSEVAELRNSKAELVSSAAELRKLEARSENLKTEIESFKRRLGEKDAQIKTLNERTNQETSRRLNLEESNRKIQRELDRSNGERNEAVSSSEALQVKFEHSQRELKATRERLTSLESESRTLRRDADNLREEIELKSAQAASAQSLMNSVRDQAAEMAAQMKEAQSRCESLEEELSDAHRLMSERGREGETMRRLLSDVETRADARVKDMKERMEVAVQERDRAEEDASSTGRRRTREVEELKGRLRETETELKRVQGAKDDVERAERELRRRREEDSLRAATAAQEMQSVKSAMSELRDALDESERQARELDAEKMEARRASEEALVRLEKLQKTNKTISDELRTLRATRVRPMDSPSSRSSMDGGLSASRITFPTAVNSPARTLTRLGSTGQTSSNGTSASGGAMDYVYLKNVLLQFLEQKDKKYQMQLVPVLGQLLHFSGEDERKWTKVVNAR